MKCWHTIFSVSIQIWYVMRENYFNTMCVCLRSNSFYWILCTLKYRPTSRWKCEKHMLRCIVYVLRKRRKKKQKIFNLDVNAICLNIFYAFFLAARNYCVSMMKNVWIWRHNLDITTNFDSFIVPLGIHIRYISIAIFKTIHFVWTQFIPNYTWSFIIIVIYFIKLYSSQTKWKNFLNWYIFTKLSLKTWNSLHR